MKPVRFRESPHGPDLFSTASRASAGVADRAKIKLDWIPAEAGEGNRRQATRRRRRWY
jgi:hypothetical protein